MKLVLIATVILCFSVIVGNAQPSSAKLSEQELEKVISALQKEDWKEAAGLSKQYLAKLQKEDADPAVAVLRYMLLFSSAGQVALGEMTYDQLQTVVNPMVGKEVQLPFGKIVTVCHGNGSICFPANGNFDVSVVLVNNKGTHIHSFVYANLQEKFDHASHLGEFATVRGIVDSIQLNPNRSTIWITRVFLKNGSIAIGK
jgi:hypothetical protein